MGAWGADSFENDDALDWLGDFCDDPGQAEPADIREELLRYSQANTYVTHHFAEASYGFHLERNSFPISTGPIVKKCPVSVKGPVNAF